jgi:autotransporter-associated beta strand protein
MKPKFALLAFIVGISLLAAFSAQAQVYWDTNGSTAGFGTAGGTWGTSDFWNTSNTGGAGTFSTTNATTVPVNFGNGATGLGAGTIAVSGTVTSGNMTFASGSGTIVLSGGTIDLGATSVISVNNAGNTISSSLSGAATSMTKAGTGTLTLSGAVANSYTGLTTVSGGVLALGKTGGVAAIGGDLTISGGDVTFAAEGVQNQIADTSTVTVTGGTSTLNGTGSNTDARVNITETIAALNVTGGIFNTGNGSKWTITGAGTFSGGIFVGSSGSPGSVTSFGSLSLTGMNGTGLIISANTFGIGGANLTTVVVGSGGLSLNDSTVRLSRGTVGSRLVLDGNVTTTGSAATGIGTFAAVGAGSARVELSSTSGSHTRTFDVGAGGDLTISVPITNGAATSGAIVKEGLGTLVLSGTNGVSTYTGGTTVNDGTLRLANSATLGATSGGLTVNTGGTLDLNSTNQAVGNFTGSGGTIVNNGTGTATLTIGTGNATGGNFQGVLANNNNAGAGVLALTKTGTGTIALSGANTYTGATTISAGTLQVGNNGAGQTGTGTVTVQSGSTILGTGIIRGSSFTAESGSTVQAGDTTAQNSYGTLTFTPVSGSGTFDLKAGSTIILGINPSGTCDQLKFISTGSSTLVVNGNLTVGPEIFTPTQAQVFQLLDWSGLTGTHTFASRFTYAGLLTGNGDEATGLNLSNISGSGFFWDISQFTANGSIAIVVPEPSRVLLLMLGLLGLISRRRSM